MLRGDFILECQVQDLFPDTILVYANNEASPMLEYEDSKLHL